MSAAALGADALINSASEAGATVAAAEMQYRLLGKTGISVSAIGFGSHVSGENMRDPTARKVQIRRGLEQGISLYDIYDHQYHQFELMREALSPVRDDVVISLVTVGPSSLVMNEVEVGLEPFKTDFQLLQIYSDAADQSGGSYLPEKYQWLEQWKA